LAIDLNSITFNERLTDESVLQLVSELDIFKYYLGEEALEMRPINSPIRRDNVPSFSLFFASKANQYFFKDFGTGETGNCFKLVQLMYGGSYLNAVEKVTYDLGLSDVNSTYKFKKLDLNDIERIKKRSEQTNLQIKSKAPTVLDKAFWSQFAITPEVLNKYNVKTVDLIFINNKIIKPAKYCYAYLEFKDKNPTYKIYQPYNEKYKFMNNNDYSVWEGWTQMPIVGDKLIITSSRKDVMSIVSTTNYPAVALQSEGVLPKDQVVEELKNRFKEIFIFYDNDYTKQENKGRVYGKKLSEKFNLPQIEIPSILESKDYSDLVKNKGKEIAIQVLNTLINNGRKSNIY